MSDETGIELKIHNKMIAEKRDLNIYHNHDRGAYMISRNNYVKLKLNGIDDNDYLHISIVSGPGAMTKDCWVNLPSWCFCSFSGMCNADICNSGERIMVRIPPGPPVWQLKISNPGSTPGADSDLLVIGDFEQIKEEGLIDNIFEQLFCNAI